ncbi:hypothetical protein H6503_04065 [Candidatus Woesearchaeota archaeon]|nr:hypothetical protein [Candidatus Woesearchaeota archaeon]
MNIYGPKPLEKDNSGNVTAKVGCVFPSIDAIITGNMPHGVLAMQIMDAHNKHLADIGKPKMSSDQISEMYDNVVDINMDNTNVYIRCTDDMDSVFKADEMISTLLGYRKLPFIKFTRVHDDKARDYIKSRGQLWRISPKPKTLEDIRNSVTQSLMSVYDDQKVFYYCYETGTRILTLEQFGKFESMNDDELRQHMIFIRDYIGKENKIGNVELELFMSNMPTEKFNVMYEHMNPREVREKYSALKELMESTTKNVFRVDDIRNTEWLNKMYSLLMAENSEEPHEVLEEEKLGLDAFKYHTQWLPGARISEGDIETDPILIEYEDNPEGLEDLCDARVPEFINNFRSEYSRIIEINIGKVGQGVSIKPTEGMKETLLAEIRVHGREEPIVKVIRMLKWDVPHYFMQGKELHEAKSLAGDYRRHTKDKYKGIKKLGAPIVNHDFKEITALVDDVEIGMGYMELDYIYAVATHKVSPTYFGRPEFDIKFFTMLGDLAAYDIVAGRRDNSMNSFFDKGNEVVFLDDEVVTDMKVINIEGLFAEYKKNMEDTAHLFSAPLKNRRKHLHDYEACIEAYCSSVERTIAQIQDNYHNKKADFDHYFFFRHFHPGGSFGYRWRKILDRLNNCKPAKVADAIRKSAIAN